MVPAESRGRLSAPGQQGRLVALFQHRLHEGLAFADARKLVLRLLELALQPAPTSLPMPMPFPRFSSISTSR
jgi:hypothetical protein